MTVETLFKSNFRNIPATLRVIADQLEQGEYGKVDIGGLVLAGPRVFENFSFGSTAEPSLLCGLYLASANRMADHIEAVGTGSRADLLSLLEEEDEDPDGAA